MRWVLVLLVACSPAPPPTAPVVAPPPAAAAPTPAAPEEVSARHIVIRVGIHHTLEEARTIIKGVRARYEAGEDFATLAKQYSEDPATARRGGDIGSFQRGTMAAGFDEVVFTMAPNTVGVAETVYGVHLVLRTK
jgi:peptidyl-prolyl cis-trans isomerase D